MGLFDEIIYRIEFKKQKKEFEKLFPDMLFTRFYILYERQNENEKPDGEFIAAARDYALCFGDGVNTDYFKSLKENIREQYGFSNSVNEHNMFQTVEPNETALEKMKKYIYSNIPVLTYNEKYELVSKVLDAYKIGTNDTHS